MGLMKFLGKTTSIVLMATGLAGTAGFGALLGVGANATYTQEIGGIKTEIGIGSISFGSAWINDKKVGLSKVPGAEPYSKLSYNDAIDAINLAAKLDTTGEVKKIADDVNKAHDEMVSGAVLVTISSLVAILGITFFALSKKKYKTNSNRLYILKEMG